MMSQSHKVSHQILAYLQREMNLLLVSYSPLILCYGKVTCVIAQATLKFIRIGYKEAIPCVSVYACE